MDFDVAYFQAQGATRSPLEPRCHDRLEAGPEIWAKGRQILDQRAARADAAIANVTGCAITFASSSCWKNTRKPA